MHKAAYTQVQVREAKRLSNIGYSHQEVAKLVTTPNHPITKNQVSGWKARGWRMVKVEAMTEWKAEHASADGTVP